MKDKLLSLIPFLLNTNLSGGDQKVNLNFTRIIEAVIMAIVGGAFAGYIAVMQMQVEVKSLKESLANNEKKLEVLEQRIYENRRK